MTGPSNELTVELHMLGGFFLHIVDVGRALSLSLSLIQHVGRIDC